MKLPKYLVLVSETEPGRGRNVTWPIYLYTIKEVRDRIASMKRRVQAEGRGYKTFQVKALSISDLPKKIKV